MPRWTFGRKLALGFAVVVLLALLVTATALIALRAVLAEQERLVNVYGANLIDAQQLETAVALRMSANRGFFLIKDQLYIDHRDEARKLFVTTLDRIESRANPQEKSQYLDGIRDLHLQQMHAADAVIGMRQNGAPLEEIVKAFPVQIVPIAQKLRAAVGAFRAYQQEQRDKAIEYASRLARWSTTLVIAISIAAVIGAAIIAYFLTRTLSRQIGSAVQHIRSSSTELQSAANQQTAGSQEQVASMNEISTTIKELLSTAKQIADSAQRVAHIAEETAVAARAGDGTVQKAHNDVASIRQQVDQIVNHMLDLGRKSQQIGGILEIINELAEQTNILAINATIEAAGAGESGRRFSVVADEIRKLADRVGGSTKEIRTLIEEIRAAVNTTVMATEGGSKAVDLGVRQFSEVTGAFRRIVDLLGTTTEAAREIELSTKQQSTAVEQVNLAVANVAQAARESEASSSQILQTVGELTALSRDLAQLVQSPSMDGRGNGKRATAAERQRV